MQGSVIVAQMGLEPIMSALEHADIVCFGLERGPGKLSARRAPIIQTKAVRPCLRSCCLCCRACAVWLSSSVRTSRSQSSGVRSYSDRISAESSERICKKLETKKQEPRCLEAAVTVWLRSWTEVEQLPLRVSGPRIRRGELPHSAWPPTRSTRRAIPIASVYLAVS